jgi:hypothetical protein
MVVQIPETDLDCPARDDNSTVNKRNLGGSVKLIHVWKNIDFLA